MKKKGFLSVLLAAAMVGSMIAAVPAAAAGEDQTLTVWCWDPNFNIYAMQQAEKLYQEDHPDFKLDIQENVYTDIETKLITAATSGDFSTLPDIFLMQDYSYHKNVASFPDVFTDLTDSGIDFTQFSTGKLADSTVDGKNYGVPFDNGATIMAIRSDIVEEAGLTTDDFKDITWSKFMELAKTVKEKTGTPMLTTSGGSELVLEMLQSAGASPVVDGEIKVADNEALKQAVEVYAELVNEGYMTEYTDWDQYIASMNNGDAAGVINGCWIMASITANDDQSGKWAITNMPKLDGVDGATNYSNNGGSSWAISSNCKKQDLAIDFMKSTFAGSTALYDDIIAKGALATWAPAGDSEAYAQPVAFFSDDPVYAKIVDFATKTPSNITGAFYYDARDAVGTALSNIIQTGADMDSELQTAQETVEFNMGG